jgi:quinoprotein glucose dehydrogenase
MMLRLSMVSIQSGALIALAAVLSSCSDQGPTGKVKSIPEIAEVEANASDWPTYGGQSSGTKYAALDQINTENVDQLKLAWTYHTGDLETDGAVADWTVSEMTPIYANERLYICTPYSRVEALDPSTGKKLWVYDPKKPLTGNMYKQNYCRGVAYWQSDDAATRDRNCGKRIFFATQNAVLLSLDADSGKACSAFGRNGRIDLSALDYKGAGKVANTSPPAIYKNVVIVGGSVADNVEKDSLDGIVRGFDAISGKELWNWNPIPAEISNVTGAANTWAPISVDIVNGLVFLPTGSASYDTLGVNRKSNIPDANAVVALDAETGRRVWSYQTVRHDLWDYDVPAMPTLATINKKGRAVDAVIQGTKTGNIFVLDRKTGMPLFPVKEMAAPKSDIPGEITSPTQPVPVSPKPVTSQTINAEDGWGALGFDASECRAKLAPFRNEGLFTPPSIRGSILHPSFLGGVNWGGIAYDPNTGLAIVNSSNLVASVKLMPREQYNEKLHKRPGVSVYEMKGAPYVMLREVLMSQLGAPCNPPPWGQLTAIDMRTGEHRWKIPFGRIEFSTKFRSLESWGAPNQGGPIVTKGGLIFIGASLDSRFRAYDIQSGKELWNYEVPAPATATPMTFKHSDGRQYIVVSAGGHGGFQTKLSDAIVAFALPE